MSDRRSWNDTISTRIKPPIATNHTAAKVLRMFRLLTFLAAIIFPSYGFAQSTQGYQPTSVVLLDQALKCEGLATTQFNQQQTKIADLTKQVEQLTQERDKAAKPEPPK